MRLVLGFDGGGTKTECVLMDESHQILTRAHSGPSNPLRVGFDAAASALQEAARRALAAASPDKPHIVAVCAGLAGTRQPDAAKKVHLSLSKIFVEAKICVLTDLALALEATGRRPSVVLVAGTGSAAIGWDAQGHTSLIGGHGPLLGDQGSAYDVGRQAVQSALRARDRTGTDIPLGTQILRQLGCADWDELQTRTRAASDEVFPRIFPVVTAAADAGDELARNLLRNAAQELAGLVEIMVERLRLREVSFLLAKTGGMLGRSRFLDAVLEGNLRHIAPRASIAGLPISQAEAAARVALALVSPAQSTGT
jgi:glucosamine kinase